VLNHGTFAGVLDSSPRDDLEIATVVRELLKREYLRVG
jgi:hypothetical protein